MRIEIPVFPEATTIVTDDVIHEIVHENHQYVIDSPKLIPRKDVPFRKPSSKKESSKLTPRKKRVQKSDK
jgi:hypothetical protein